MSKAEKSTVDSFDLSVFDTKTASEAGLEFEVMHPLTGGTGFFIGMKGTHSEKVQTELKRINNRAKAARAGTFRKDDDHEGARFLASITTHWRSEDSEGNARPVSLNGVERAFNQGNVEATYIEFPLIADQATQFVFDAANFLKG